MKYLENKTIEKIRLKYNYVKYFLPHNYLIVLLLFKCYYEILFTTVDNSSQL